MKYYNEILTKDNLILSCDMVRIVFRFSSYIIKKFNDYLFELSMSNSAYDYSVYYSNSSFSYKNMINFKNKDSSFVVGLGFNGVKNEDNKSCFIEFNPNKCLSNDYVTPILSFIKIYGTALEISRYDFAIDIKCKRSLCSLSKDLRDYNKVYRFEKTSIDIDNVTEYLGHRNKNGFVKLYNKTKESNLDYDLTRLEITLDSFDYENFKKQLPIVYFVKKNDFFDFEKLNDTDKVLLSLLLQSNNSSIYLKMLGRGKQEKFKKILFDLNSIICVTEFDYYNLVRNIRQIIA